MKKLDILNLILFPLSVIQIVFNNGSVWVAMAWLYVIIASISYGIRFITYKRRKQLEKQESTKYF